MFYFLCFIVHQASLLEAAVKSKLHLTPFVRGDFYLLYKEGVFHPLFFSKNSRDVTIRLTPIVLWKTGFINIK